MKKKRVVVAPLTGDMFSLPTVTDDFLAVDKQFLNDGAEHDFYEGTTFLIQEARKEGSRVFILGCGRQAVSSSLIKAAELIVNGSGVIRVLIPIVYEDASDTVGGRILYVGEKGIFTASLIKPMTYLHDFWKRVLVSARETDAGLLANDCALTSA